MLAMVKEKVLSQTHSVWLRTGMDEIWNGLAENDQRAIKILSFVLLLISLYFLVWQPIHQANHNANQQLARSEADWQWLNQQVPKLNQKGATTQILTIQTQSQLTQVIQSSLKKQNLYRQMSEIQPLQVERVPGVMVSFDKVDAPRFFRWLSKLEKQAVVSHQMKIEKTEIQGRISASVRFQVRRK